METISEYTKIKKMQIPLNTWLSQGFEWHYSLTFIFNSKKINFLTGPKKLSLFHALVDGNMYGKDFSELNPVTERTFFIAFPEHKDSNLHYHALLRTPEPKRFRAIAEEVWKKLVPSGHLYFSNAVLGLTPEEAFDAANYDTKECYKRDQYGDFIISTQFAREWHAIN